MDFAFTPEQEEFVQEVRTFIRERVPAALLKRLRGGPESGGGDDYQAAAREFKQLLYKAGLLGVNWPPEYGGRGAPHIFQYFLAEELSYQDLPGAGLTLTSVAPMIWRAGTEEQKKQYLRGIFEGEIEFAIGYTEPNAGSDLASLQTQAIKDGDDYIIRGQKMFTSGAHMSTHIWLAARTDPNAPKHRGVSMIIVPLNLPGITVRPLWTMGDGRTNEVFFDDVRVPRRNLVGEENRGWYTMSAALDFERAAVAPLSPLRRILEDLVKFCKETKHNGLALAEDPIIRNKLAELTVDLGILRLFSLRNAWVIDKGAVPNVEGSMIKVWSSELRERLLATGLEIMGPFGQLQPGSKWVPFQGRFEVGLRASPQYRFTAGSNEIQRNIIAQRGLGLPR